VGSVAVVGLRTERTTDGLSKSQKTTVSGTSAATRPVDSSVGSILTPIRTAGSASNVGRARRKPSSTWAEYGWPALPKRQSTT
jgi:hypothetical protein